MTSSQANDPGVPDEPTLYDRTNKTVFQDLEYLFEAVDELKAAGTPAGSGTDLTDLEKRVSNLEVEVGVPSPNDIPAADSGGTSPAS